MVPHGAEAASAAVRGDDVDALSTATADGSTRGCVSMVTFVPLPSLASATCTDDLERFSRMMGSADADDECWLLDCWCCVWCCVWCDADDDDDAADDDQEHEHENEHEHEHSHDTVIAPKVPGSRRGRRSKKAQAAAAAEKLLETVPPQTTSAPPAVSDVSAPTPVASTAMAGIDPDIANDPALMEQLQTAQRLGAIIPLPSSSASVASAVCAFVGVAANFTTVRPVIHRSSFSVCGKDTYSPRICYSPQYSFFDRCVHFQQRNKKFICKT